MRREEKTRRNIFPQIDNQSSLYVMNNVFSCNNKEYFL
jgi:hypothetical protein